MRLFYILGIAAGAFSNPITGRERRGLLDFLEGDVGEAVQSAQAVPTAQIAAEGGGTPVEAGGEKGILTAHRHGPTSVTSPGTNSYSVTVLGSSTSVPTSTHRGVSATGGSRTTGTFSVISGVPNTSATSWMPAQSISMTGATATNEQVSATPPGELAQWKVIGISIICVTFVGVVIMAATFFDTWTAFLRDVFGCGGCGRGRDKGMQTGRESMNLAPNWDRRTWEFKLANEDGHRYPTMPSADSLRKV